MTSILEFFNQPIVLTAFSLAIGGYLINSIADRRARKDKLRDKAIEFLTELGAALNSVISDMNGVLHLNMPLTEQELNESVISLYRKRMSLRVASEAYLDSESLPVQYDQILHELVGVAGYLRSIPATGALDADSGAINERRNILLQSWPLDGEPPRPRTDSASGELMLWLDMILDRITAVLSGHLKAATR
jgi:hypothetical protein